MYALYSLLLTLGFIILLPRFALDAWRSGKYVTGLRQRLGQIPEINSHGKRVVWLHCVSVGEAQAAQSLVCAMTERYPNLAVLISTTTITGQKVAHDVYRDQAVAVFYFPIDWAWTVRRVLRRLRPAAILVMETELWPNLFRQADKLKIPIAVLNGRLSDKSFRRYRMVRPFIRRVLMDVTLAAVQTERDAERFRELGMPPERVNISGNLKFDSPASTSTFAEVADDLCRRFGFTDDRPLIVAASTHEPEERVALDAFRTVRQSHPRTRLIIAPRHPERFEQVASLLEGSEFSVARRSAAPAAADRLADVVLLDSIGELRAMYPLAQVALVGGSIVPHGGHSVIEPAAHGICTVTGPHTQNFDAVTRALLKQDALIQLPDTHQPAAELARVLCELLADNVRREKIGRRARAVCELHRGATGRTLDLISGLLSTIPTESEPGLHFSPLPATAAK